MKLQWKSIAKEVVGIKQQTTSELVQEIHETFFTEVDRLLAEAKITIQVNDPKKDLIAKAKRLEALGFRETKTVKEARVAKAIVLDAEEKNRKKQHLAEAIYYFSYKYPQYKFITEASVKKICQKYGLIYGTVGKYKGEVPDKNLEHIENFKIHEDDASYIGAKRYRGIAGNYSAYMPSRPTPMNCSMQEMIKLSKEDRYNPIETTGTEPLNMTVMGNSIRIRTGIHDYEFEKAPLEIAAPASDFDISMMDVKDFKLTKKEIPDPVVLAPVLFRENKYYLIVTAWGDEASDELVVNEKMN